MSIYLLFCQSITIQANILIFSLFFFKSMCENAQIASTARDRRLAYWGVLHKMENFIQFDVNGRFAGYRLHTASVFCVTKSSFLDFSFLVWGSWFCLPPAPLSFLKVSSPSTPVCISRRLGASLSYFGSDPTFRSICVSLLFTPLFASPLFYLLPHLLSRIFSFFSQSPSTLCQSSLPSLARLFPNSNISHALKFKSWTLIWKVLSYHLISTPPLGVVAEAQKYHSVPLPSLNHGARLRRVGFQSS